MNTYFYLSGCEFVFVTVHSADRIKSWSLTIPFIVFDKHAYWLLQ